MADQETRERRIAALGRRGVLPIAIVASVDGPASTYDAWELVYDDVGQIMSRQHAYGQDQRWVVRRIRVDEPADMVSASTVPFAKRDYEAEARKAKERAAYVSRIADSIIRGDGPGANLKVDFDLEREVLDELWRRWREVTADGFLMRALMS